MNETNPRVMILFSGTTGSGKSFLAKNIEEKFRGVRINNDDVRDIIKEEIVPNYDLSSVDFQKLLEEYLMYLFENVPKINGLLILDSSIDRKYKLVRELANKYNYEIFLIRIDLPKETLKRQIRQRSGRDSGPYLRDLERHLDDHQKIASEIKVDYLISEGNFDRFDDLYSVVNQKMKVVA